MAEDRLEINILYCSDEGREVSFTDLANQTNVMDPKHYEAGNFWSVFGGFEVTLNGHFTIFRSCNFYCLVKATSFLISSLYWLKDKKSDWFDQDDDFPNSLSINPIPNTVVKLQRTNDEEILFSYTSNNDKYVFKRGDRYFNGIRISIHDWITQTNIALGEYFEILSVVLDKDDTSDRIVDTMREYKELWRNIATQ